MKFHRIGRALDTGFLGILLGLAWLLSAPAIQATTVPFKELTSLVAEADHVLVGTVTKVDMVDGQGQAVTDQQARTGPGHPNQLRLHVAVDTNRVLATTAKLPAVLVVPLWRNWHDTLGNRQRETQGKTFVFLLKGPGFAPVYPGLFMRDMSEQPAIERLLNRREAEATPLAIDCHRAEDNITVARQDDGLVCIVTSPRGIGRATLTLRRGDWPNPLKLRFNLKGLEGLTVDTGNGKPHELSHRDANVKPVDGGFEVVIPREWLGEGVKSLALQWVDFYR